MSRVYFHSPSGIAELSGRERHYANMTCNDLLWNTLRRFTLDDSINNPSVVRAILPYDSYVHRVVHGFEETLRTYLYGFDGNFQIGGKAINVFTLALNTALVGGSDAVKLLARIHGQCEIHCWVDGINRAWLADIAERGLKDAVLRPDEGWDDVIAFLRQNDQEPVVLSYSVTEQFPNRHVADWRDEHDGDGWYELPQAEQWRLAMGKLREQSGFLEMKPETWDEIRFNSGESGFTAAAHLQKLVEQRDMEKTK